MSDWGHHHNDIAQCTSAPRPGPRRSPAVPSSRGPLAPDVFEPLPVSERITPICATRSHGVRFEAKKPVHVDRGFPKPRSQIIEDYPGRASSRPCSVGHHQDWLDSSKSRTRPSCVADIGHRSVTVCHLGNIAIRTGRKLVWDPVAERITNDEALNRWLGKPYRPPWHL